MSNLMMPASLSREDVLRIAELARLELTTNEVDLFTRQLADILQYVEQIRELDTTGVMPTAHVINRPIDRSDEIVPPLPRHEALVNAPDAATEAGLFKVPRVMA
ncbi:MAG TPA: Asp-tRNA(Asn)/Glu-tRNA(Gln) amidotransferase subunit GatC [Vicinamibacterales bacterium]|nr:Asp-tRNA(Asn)/Glu-tRNA(Gln) amidotransferase subunit GatC [Vicinamibacterales bacterium]